MKKTKLLIVEEVFNSITHGIGSLLSIAALVSLLLLPEQTPLKTIGLSVFGGVLILAYTFSTLYHSLTFTRAKKVFKILDHSAIFLLIAGTYTALISQVLRNRFGLILLIVIWVSCIWGIVQKSIWIHKWKKITLLFYLLLGWIGVLLAKPMLHVLPLNSFILLAIGGLLYTSGVGFYLWKKLPFSHMIWHLFVLGGSLCHFFAIYRA
jgi:hemolysin III